MYADDLQFEDLKLDSRKHELRRNGRNVALTRTEFALLEKLLRNAGSIVPRDSLVEAGWGHSVDVNDSTLYVFIRALRNKIAAYDETQLLHTVRGVGYTLRGATN
jgi:DNA-binding response OmpR family regulator